MNRKTKKSFVSLSLKYHSLVTLIACTALLFISSTAGAATDPLRQLFISIGKYQSKISSQKVSDTKNQTISDFNDVEWGADTQAIIDKHGSLEIDVSSRRNNLSEITRRHTPIFMSYDQYILDEDVKTQFVVHPDKGLMGGMYEVHFSKENSCEQLVGRVKKFVDAVKSQYQKISKTSLKREAIYNCSHLQNLPTNRADTEKQFRIFKISISDKNNNSIDLELIWWLRSRRFDNHLEKKDHPKKLYSLSISYETDQYKKFKETRREKIKEKRF